MSDARIPTGKDVYYFRAAHSKVNKSHGTKHSVSAKDQVCRPPVNTDVVIKEAVFKTSRNSKATAVYANRCLANVSDESAYEDLDMVNVGAKLPTDFNMEQENWPLKSIPSLAVPNKPQMD